LLCLLCFLSCLLLAEHLGMELNVVTEMRLNEIVRVVVAVLETPNMKGVEGVREHADPGSFGRRFAAYVHADLDGLPDLVARGLESLRQQLALLEELVVVAL